MPYESVALIALICKYLWKLILEQMRTVSGSNLPPQNVSLAYLENNQGPINSGRTFELLSNCLKQFRVSVPRTELSPLIPAKYQLFFVHIVVGKLSRA